MRSLKRACNMTMGTCLSRSQACVPPTHKFAPEKNKNSFVNLKLDSKGGEANLRPEASSP